MFLFFIISSLMSISFALVGSALLRPGGWLVRLPAAGVLWMAHMVATAHLAAFMIELDNPSVWLLWQSVQLIAVIGCWYMDGQPRLWQPLNISGWNLRKSLRRDMLIWMLAAVVLAGYIASVILNIYVPQIEFDALTYRLPRAGLYFQHGTFAPYAVNDIRQTIFPLNAEILLIWLRLGTGSDLYSGFIAMVALLATATGIIALTHRAGFSTRAGVAAGLLYLVLPQVYFQSTSIQSDSLVGFLAVSAVILLYDGFQANRRRYLMLSGIAIGLAAGVKLTLVLLIPGVGLMLLLLWWQNPTAYTRRALIWGIAALFGFGLFGSYIYVTNTISYGDPLFNGQMTGELMFNERELVGLEKRLNYVLVNLVWMSYQIPDLTGLPRFMGEPLRMLKTDVYRLLFEDTFLMYGSITRRAGQEFGQEYILNHIGSWHLPLEAFAWFGLPAAFVLLPSLVLGFIRSIKRRHVFRISLALIVVGFFAAQIISQPWSPYKGRYFVSAVPFAMPFVFWLVQSGWWKRGVFLVVIGLSAMTTVNIFHSSYDNAIFMRAFQLNETELRNRPVIVDEINELKARHISGNSPVGVLLPPDAIPNRLIYGLMGADWSQPVVIINPEAYNQPERLPEYLEAGTTFLTGGSNRPYLNESPPFLVIQKPYLDAIEPYLTDYRLTDETERLYLFERQ